jgi:hypothetical protein
MTAWICVSCGVQQPPSQRPPAHCVICDDFRQWVPASGQRWTSMEELAAGNRNRIREQERDLIGIGTDPAFAIGQRALLLRTQPGNLLWDCVSLLDRETITAVAELGGVQAIAVSHPHFYASMAEWSQTFGAPIWLPAADRAWRQRHDADIREWEGEAEPLAGLRLIQAGGHFRGGAILHWPAGAEGHGALLTGDIFSVAADTRFVSWMLSYPNHLPLPAAEIERMVELVEPLAFDRIYGAWWDRVMPGDARAAVRRSADRYLAALEGRLTS